MYSIRVRMIFNISLSIYRWYIHILSYVTQLLPTTDNKNKFIADLVGKWQACLLTQFEEYDPISASDEGMF